MEENEMLSLDVEARNYAYMRLEEITRSPLGAPSGDRFHDMIKTAFEDGFEYEHSILSPGTAILPTIAAYHYSRWVAEPSTNTNWHARDNQLFLLNALESAFVRGGMYRRKNRYGGTE